MASISHSEAMLKEAAKPYRHFDSSKTPDIKKIEWYLEHGADVNIRNSQGQTALMLTCLNGNLAVVKCLLRHGADVNISDKDGQNAYTCAHLTANWDIKNELFAEEARRTEQKRAAAEQILHDAAILRRGLPTLGKTEALAQIRTAGRRMAP